MLAASAVTVMVSVPLPRVSVNLPASRVSLAAMMIVFRSDGGGLFRTGKLNACRFRRHRDGLRPASESEREFTGIAGFVGRDDDRVQIGWRWPFPNWQVECLPLPPSP